MSRCLDSMSYNIPNHAGSSCMDLTGDLVEVQGGWVMRSGRWGGFDIFVLGGEEDSEWSFESTFDLTLYSLSGMVASGMAGNERMAKSCTNMTTSGPISALIVLMGHLCHWSPRGIAC